MEPPSQTDGVAHGLARDERGGQHVCDGHSQARGIACAHMPGMLASMPFHQRPCIRMRSGVGMDASVPAVGACVWIDATYVNVSSGSKRCGV
jgi:hypothetical protein